MGTLANNEDPDEMQHNAAFNQGQGQEANNLWGQKNIKILEHVTK